jgi:hypothetical protein
VKPRIIEHITSILLVSGVLIALLLVARHTKANPERGADEQVRELAALSFVNAGRPFDRALLADVLDLYYPGRHDINAATAAAVEQYQQKSLSTAMQESHVTEHLTPAKLGQLGGMYVSFVLIYLLVLVVTYYGVQTIGVWRFVRKKRRAWSDGSADGWKPRLQRIAAGTARVVGSFLLFCPAYVIAYSIRSEFGTDTVPFMVLLAVISNGLLLVYSNKFYAFLVAESRKGYVETALVKNLNASYEPLGEDGIRYGAIFAVRKRYAGHVFNQIFRNARHQYLSSVKEQASFLISGLIIIEMALNIHGHLNYEMLRQILYGNYDIVIAIILGIFYTVKATEIGVDVIVYRETKKYENK